MFVGFNQSGGTLTTDIPAGTRGFYAAVAPLAGNGHNSADFRDDIRDDIVESMTTVDVQYTYSFGEKPRNGIDSRLIRVMPLRRTTWA